MAAPVVPVKMAALGKMVAPVKMTSLGSLLSLQPQQELSKVSCLLS